MEAFEIAQLLVEQNHLDQCYVEFLRTGTLSMGLYVLPAGAVDTQEPRAEDEVYYVVGGKGVLRAGKKDTVVSAGSIVYVPAGQKHYFYNIADELKLLVFFVPVDAQADSNAAV